MTKFAIIAVVNLLIIVLISGNAALSLLDGSSGGVWTWLIAAGLPLIALAVMAKAWRDLARDRAARARALPPAARLETLPDEDDGGARMRSRLSRMQRAEPEQSPVDESSGSGNSGWNWIFGEGEDGVAIAAGADASGFPWVAAGIDHLCEALLAGGRPDCDGALQTEAAAWRSVVAGLPREQMLAREDAVAFGAWLAQYVEGVGPDARGALIGAMEALATEARGDPALATALPQRFHASGTIGAPPPKAG